MDKIRHISATGYNAGQLLCGKPRQFADHDGERSAHPGAWLHNDAAVSQLCPGCIKAWLAVGGTIGCGDNG